MKVVIKYLILWKNVLDFNKQQKGKRLKVLAAKQMLQMLLLLISLAQIKSDSTSENLPNEIHQTTYLL